MNNLLSEIDKEFEEKFTFNFDWGLDHSAGEYGLDVQGWEDLQIFLHQAVKRAYEEGTRDAVKYIAERSESQVGEFTSLINDSTFKEALSELNKKK